MMDKLWTMMVVAVVVLIASAIVSGIYAAGTWAMDEQAQLQCGLTLAELSRKLPGCLEWEYHEDPATGERSAIWPAELPDKCAATWQANQCPILDAPYRYSGQPPSGEVFLGDDQIVAWTAEPVSRDGKYRILETNWAVSEAWDHEISWYYQRVYFGSSVAEELSPEELRQEVDYRRETGLPELGSE